jgi:hypothetical protein
MCVQKSFEEMQAAVAARKQQQQQGQDSSSSRDPPAQQTAYHLTSSWADSMRGRRVGAEEAAALGVEALPESAAAGPQQQPSGSGSSSARSRDV